MPQTADAGTRYRAGPVSDAVYRGTGHAARGNRQHHARQPLAEFYPDLPNALEITYRDLLAHRSGLADYTAAPDFQDWRTRPQDARRNARPIEHRRRDGSRRASGSNTTTATTCCWVTCWRRSTDRSYDDILLRQIVGKLGMSRTYFAGTGDPQLESRPYRTHSTGWVRNGTDRPVRRRAAHAAWSPTPGEWCVSWTRCSRAAGESAVLGSMRDQEGGSGLGLWPYVIAGESGFGHAGGIDGFTAAVYHFPARGISIACMSTRPCFR